LRPSFRPGIDVLEDRIVLSLFASPTFAVGTNPVAKAVGDFNGDGKKDLAVVNQQSNTVSVLLGNGDGSFKPAVSYPTAFSPRGIAVGDFNGDGPLDLTVANSGSNSISLLLGNGDGTFQPKIDTALPLTPISLTVDDFNGDGKADLAIGGATAT